MILDSDIKRPALLLGNGLNNYTHVGIPWIVLLKDLINEFIPPERRAGIAELLKKRGGQKGGITYPELFDTLWLRDGRGAEETSYDETIEFYRDIKKAVAKKIQNWEGKEPHRRLVEFASKNQIPVLTTNYDTALPSAGQGTPVPRRIQNTHFPKSDFYPWDACYSDHAVGTAREEFGIWHIHGFAAYPRSLVLGINDYINVINKLGTLLTELYQHKEPWTGTNTWVDIFLNRDLVILGLGLESQEITIRRLLLERYKYIRRNNKDLKTLYVYDKKYDPCKKDKRYFFESLNIAVRGMTGKELYERWEWSRH